MLIPFWRKFVLVLHITSAVGFMGAVAGFLALSVAGLTASTGAIATATYLAMQILAWYVIGPLAVASLVVGIIQSLGTAWGLIRHYWVIVKLALTLLALVVLMLQMTNIDLLAQAAQEGTLGRYGTQRFSMVLHATGGLVILIVATVLSIYKPQGVTPRGATMMAGLR